MPGNQAGCELRRRGRAATLLILFNAFQAPVEVDAHNPFSVEPIGFDPPLDGGLIGGLNLKEHSAAQLTCSGPANPYFFRFEGLPHQFAQSLLGETRVTWDEK